jgi:hypothetical protein
VIVQNAPAQLAIEKVVADLIAALLDHLKTVTKLVNDVPLQRQWLRVGR